MNTRSLDDIFASVKSRYDARDAKLGKKTFSSDDWDRTRIAFELFHNAQKVIDIGIGQGQLVNLFCELPHVEKVIGVDRTKHTKLIAPTSEKYSFRSLDITQPFPDDLPQSDITIAMEIFEHIDVDKVVEAVTRAKQSSRHEMLFASVPYQEKHPLYHHDKPHGHKQSFDHDTVAAVFGTESIWTNYRNRWYLIFVSEKIEQSGEMPIQTFEKCVGNCLAKI